MSVLFLLKTFCSLGGALALKGRAFEHNFGPGRGGGGFEGANVQKLNAWGGRSGGYLEVSN